MKLSTLLSRVIASLVQPSSLITRSISSLNSTATPGCAATSSSAWTKVCYDKLALKASYAISFGLELTFEDVWIAAQLVANIEREMLSISLLFVNVISVMCWSMSCYYNHICKVAMSILTQVEHTGVLSLSLLSTIQIRSWIRGSKILWPRVIFFLARLAKWATTLDCPFGCKNTKRRDPLNTHYLNGFGNMINTFLVHATCSECWITRSKYCSWRPSEKEE